MKHRRLFTNFIRSFAAGLVLAAACLGQSETEPASRSELVGIALPQGAARINTASVPSEISETLRKFASIDPRLRQGSSEVLVWTGSDLKRTGSDAIVRGVAGGLGADGWKFEIGGKEDGITVFTALKEASERRAVIGLYGEADGTLMIAWTELLPASASTPAAAADGPVISGLGDAGYSFPTPSGWTRAEKADRIVLTKGDDKAIAFLPLMDSSGDLERDAERIVWQVFRGEGPWHGNGFEPDYGTFERGRTAQGLEYFRVYRYGKKASDPNEGFVASRFDAIILLVKLGDKVAVIAGRQPFQSDFARDSVLNTLDLILYDLTFKNAPGGYDLKKEVIGSWSAASTTVALAYTFGPNGRFDKGGAIQFRTSRDAYTDNVTTTSYGLTDTYSIAGNVMTQTYKRTGQIVKHKLRVYQTRYNKDPWQQKLGFWPIADPEGGTMVLRKSE